MQTRIVHCDRCKVLITKNRVLLIVRAGRTSRLTHGKGVDLCDACSRQFEEWLGPNVPEHPTTEADIETADDF